MLGQRLNNTSKLYALCKAFCFLQGFVWPHEKYDKGSADGVTFSEQRENNWFTCL